MSLKYSNSGGAQLSTSWTLKCTDLPQFDALQAAAEEFEDGKLHLRNLCSDSARVAGLVATHVSSSTPSRKMILDYSRQRITGEVAELLYDLADAMSLTDRIKGMRHGSNVNATENRPVLHHLLRVPVDIGRPSPAMQSSTAQHTSTASAGQPPAPNKRTGGNKPTPPLLSNKKPETVQRQTSNRNKSIASAEVSTSRILKDIFQVRDKIQTFATQVHHAQIVGATGRPFKHFVVIASSAFPQGLSGIATALKLGDSPAQAMSQGRSLHFVTNVDPVCVTDCTRKLHADETMVIILSKTFTEPDVLLNARTLRHWLSRQMRIGESEVNQHHLVAVSCNPTRCSQFGIPKDRVFRLMEWIVPRFATCSAIGLLPLSLVFGWDVCARLLQGCHDMDDHFFHAPLRDNIPVILGLLGFWNSTFLGYPCRAVLPYSEALRRFPEFVQQVDMESNGKRVALDGTCLLHKSAEINFGGAGTSCQSHFIQLLHQGRVVPADFIGFMESSHDVDLPDEPVSNHDELMSNFFAQPDALAYGKTLLDCTLWQR